VDEATTAEPGDRVGPVSPLPVRCSAPGSKTLPGALSFASVAALAWSARQAALPAWPSVTGASVVLAALAMALLILGVAQHLRAIRVTLERR
jgi:hypothetical protein